MESDQKTYETGYLLTPLLPENKVMEEVSALRKIIEDNNGFIMSEDHPKMQKLAYPIKQNNSAYFGRIKFYVKSEMVDKVKESFEKNDKAIRFLITESGKEQSRQTPRTIRKIVKPTLSAPPAEERKPIKLEEIDKKLEEILKKSSV